MVDKMIKFIAVITHSSPGSPAIYVVGGAGTVAINRLDEKSQTQTSVVGPEVVPENSRQFASRETGPPILRAFVGMVTIRKQ
jgi:hypothetical protein